MNNPLDDLIANPIPPSPKRHSSGRRELRQERLAGGITIRARARTTEEQERAILKGEGCATLPIRRPTEKRMGMTKKEYKRWKRGEREQA